MRDGKTGSNGRQEVSVMFFFNSSVISSDYNDNKVKQQMSKAKQNNLGKGPVSFKMKKMRNAIRSKMIIKNDMIDKDSL